MFLQSIRLAFLPETTHTEASGDASALSDDACCAIERPRTEQQHVT